MVASKLLPDCSGLSPICIACLLLDCSMSLSLEQRIGTAEACQGRPSGRYVLFHPGAGWKPTLMFSVSPKGGETLNRGDQWGRFDEVLVHALRSKAHAEACFQRRGSVL